MQNSISLVQRDIHNKHREKENLFNRLQSFSPQNDIYKSKILLNELTERLKKTLPIALKEKSYILDEKISKLETISPLKTLKRGYSVALKDELIIKNIDQVNINDNIKLRVSDGYINCEVLEKTKLDR